MIIYNGSTTKRSVFQISLDALKGRASMYTRLAAAKQQSFSFGFNKTVVYNLQADGKYKRDAELKIFDPETIGHETLFGEEALDWQLALDLGKSKKLMLKPGVGVVLGKSGTGKTLLTRYVLEALNQKDVAYISFREPTEGSIVREATAYLAMLNALEPVIVFDSIRSILFASDTKGATGKGGIHMGIFQILTVWDLMARALGKHVIFVFNPLSNDEEALELYKEALIGSVSMVITTSEPGSFDVSSRFSKTRDFKKLTYELPSSGQAMQQAQNDLASKQRIATVNDDRTRSIADIFSYDIKGDK